MPVNDIHWHISRQYPVEESLAHIMHQMNYLGVDKIVALAMAQTSKGEIDNLSNLKAIYLRDRSEGRIYAYGSLRYYCDERDNGDEMLRQIKRLHEMGVDGIKMLEGKNCIHEEYGCKLDGERYAKVFKYIEENDIPLLIHVADNVPFTHPENEALREKSV